MNSIGIAKSEARGEYIPTNNCIEFVRLYKWDEEKAKNSLLAILLNTWITSHTKKILTVRKKVTKEELIKELGLYADADKDKDYKKLERLVEWMIWSNFIIEDDGQISLITENQVSINTQKLIKYAVKDKTSPTIDDVKVLKQKIDQNQQEPLNNIRFMIKITPETGIDEIRKMIKTIKKALSDEKIN